MDLLAELKVILPIGEDGLLGRPPGFWDGDETDSQVLRKIRKEQADLRRGLLQGRASADCSICGALLPARLLIAGHIKPRSKCTDEERRDYNSAMLVCNLGCDAMFEWGYVVVDGTGRVRASRTPETTAVEKVVAGLSGKICSAFNRYTAKKFAEHALMAPESWAGPGIGAGNRFASDGLNRAKSSRGQGTGPAEG